MIVVGNFLRDSSGKGENNLWSPTVVLDSMYISSKQELAFTEILILYLHKYQNKGFTLLCKCVDLNLSAMLRDKELQ